MDNKFKTKQLSYWQGTFGDYYTDRTFDSKMFIRRKKFFNKFLKNFDAIDSVLEVGCNVGRNLEILKAIKPELSVWGIEPNTKAFRIACKSLSGSRIFKKSIFDIKWSNKFDLVFTAGVLIHIGDEDSEKAIRKICEASRRYILAIEYYSKKRVAVLYRGLEDALYKRPYDKEFLGLFPKLKIKYMGKLDQVDGFDDCKFWLFEK